MKKNDPGVLLVLSGPSGCGKGTVVKELLNRRADMVLSVSATTRAPRAGETDGVEYFFHTPERFEQMIEAGELLEYARYAGNWYGTPRAAVERQLENGKVVLLEIEVQGAEKVMHQMPQCVSVFLTAPSMEEIERRLHKRGTESEEVIKRRMDAAYEELRHADRYKYTVINDDLEHAVFQLNCIIEAERLKNSRKTQN